MMIDFLKNSRITDDTIKAVRGKFTDPEISNAVALGVSTVIITSMLDIVNSKDEELLEQLHTYLKSVEARYSEK